MQIIIHSHANTKIAELISDKVVIAKSEDILDIIGNAYYDGADSIILHEKNIISDFFDLKTKIACETLQKFSNYRMRLAIVGEFSKYSSQSLKEFIFESNKNKRINFVDSIAEAINILSK